MKFAIIGARVILGLIFVVFGLNGFFHFIENPEMNEPMTALMMALGGTGYFMVIVKAVEVVSGLMILTGRFLPLGLILLAPVSVHIFFAHLMLDQAGLPMAIVIIVLQLFLAFAYRARTASSSSPTQSRPARAEPGFAWPHTGGRVEGSVRSFPSRARLALSGSAEHLEELPIVDDDGRLDGEQVRPLVGPLAHGDCVVRLDERVASAVARVVPPADHLDAVGWLTPGFEEAFDRFISVLWANRVLGDELHGQCSRGVAAVYVEHWMMPVASNSIKRLSTRPLGGYHIGAKRSRPSDLDSD